MTNHCDSGKCSLPNVKQPCYKDRCISGLLCAPKDNKRICLKPRDAACSKSEECVTGFCSRTKGCTNRQTSRKSMTVRAKTFPHQNLKREYRIPNGYRYKSHRLVEVRDFQFAQSRVVEKRSGSTVTALEVQVQTRGNALLKKTYEVRLDVTIEQKDP